MIPHAPQLLAELVRSTHDKSPHGTPLGGHPTSLTASIAPSPTASTSPASLATPIPAQLPGNSPVYGRTSVCASTPTHCPVSTWHRSLGAHVRDTHASANSSRSSPVQPFAKRTDARCATTAVSRVHPVGRAHPSACTHSGDPSLSSNETTVTHSGSACSPSSGPTAVMRRLRSTPS